ncbi:zona pellucida glycoprotein 3e isoform X1 [Hoplias malabaricus]|uniref:zona pellucida glycoprotein 3e isoform X1 n=1 Tax=Hoplias malabaricus TaxID=27720 RepID=UPI003461995E
MGLRQGGLAVVLLVAFGFSEARRLGLTTLQTAALWPTDTNVPPPGSPSLVQAQAKPLPQNSLPAFLLQDSMNFQSQQVLQGPSKLLTWHYPPVPQVTRPPPVQFEPQQPVQVQAVAVECNDNSIYVEVKKDLFGTGIVIDPSVLTLGGCAVQGEDSDAQVFILQSELHDCNSSLRLTQDELVYSFTLAYASMPISPGVPIARTSSAAVSLECHYPRLHNVSSNALLPAWIPYASTEFGQEHLVFSLRLMMDDWVYERPSNQYYLGDLINIEASVMQYYHVPLRLFVDRCVATAVPDVNAVPRYPFIDNYGCMLDAKLTGSKSQYLPQTQADRLQFQLEAFLFHEDTSGFIYITCQLKVNAASSPVDAEHKACSFSNNGWAAMYGGNQLCSCCDSSCDMASRKGRDLSSEDLYIKEVTLGPFTVKEDL